MNQRAELRDVLKEAIKTSKEKEKVQKTSEVSNYNIDKNDGLRKVERQFGPFLMVR